MQGLGVVDVEVSVVGVAEVVVVVTLTHIFTCMYRQKKRVDNFSPKNNHSENQIFHSGDNHH